MDLTKNDHAEKKKEDEETSSAGTEPSFKTISFDVLQLKDPIPPDAPRDSKFWTAKQASEVLRRENEQDRISKMEAKIENALRDRHLEVERMNRRREKYSTDLANAAQRKIQAKGIKARQAEEARLKEEAFAKIQTGQYPQ
ncbi:unnamed protein product [Caenorhabditis brenneri]